MKIEQDVQAFQPVVITLESMEEVQAVLRCTDARIGVLDGNPEQEAELEFIDTLDEFLRGVK